MVLAREWEAEAEALKTEEARLAKRRKALENRADSVRGYLLAQLVAAGIDKLKTKLFGITVNKPRKSVVVGDLEMLPPEFVRTKKEADKVAIKKVLEEGGQVPGAHLEDGQPSLTVK
ncbi:MAG: siphovirus Gp157 family protein [Dehalococcoidia bacterium]|nr:siphovirus Gp157 family protein [Dehalococcoidia bacterium]